MKTVTAKEVRQKFAQLIETARRGTPISITRLGKKVAELTGAAEGPSRRLPDLTEFRASLKSGRNGRRATIEDLRRAERS